MRMVNISDKMPTNIEHIANIERSPWKRHQTI